MGAGPSLDRELAARRVKLGASHGEVCALGPEALAVVELRDLGERTLLAVAGFALADDLAAVVAFSTGTSWGTFAIMLPIAVPAAQRLGLPLSPFVGAALSGGVFGDHASPISDTTIVSSMAAATDHIDHVRTQLPYALLAAAAALAAFTITGALVG